MSDSKHADQSGPPVSRPEGTTDPWAKKRAAGQSVGKRAGRKDRSPQEDRSTQKGRTDKPDRAGAGSAGKQREPAEKPGAGNRSGPATAKSRHHAAGSADGKTVAARAGTRRAAAETDGERLQKVLANAGLGSRRAAEQLIEQGLVKVNGAVATLGQRALPQDRIEVDGRLLHLDEARSSTFVLLYNKPEGEVCTREDPDGRPTVFNSLPRVRSGRWISVGRLDINTSGLLIFVNDGELANRLMHPSNVVEREYIVRVRGEFTDEAVQQLLAGVELEDGPARFTAIREGHASGSHRWFECVLLEGRKREVRRLWEHIGCQVSRLKRSRFGPVALPAQVRQGQWQYASADLARRLYEMVGLSLPSNYVATTDPRKGQAGVTHGGKVSTPAARKRGRTIADGRKRQGRTEEWSTHQKDSSTGASARPNARPGQPERGDRTRGGKSAAGKENRRAGNTGPRKGSRRGQEAAPRGRDTSRDQ